MGLYVFGICFDRKGVIVLPAALSVEEMAISSNSSSWSCFNTFSGPVTALPLKPPCSEDGLSSIIEERLRLRVELRREEGAEERMVGEEVATCV